MPSGLIEDGEDGLTTAKRELQEEIGAKVISIERTATPAYTSCGLTDENIDFYKAEVEIGKQELDGFEDIGVIGGAKLRIHDDVKYPKLIVDDSCPIKVVSQFNTFHVCLLLSFCIIYYNTKRKNARK